MTTCPNYCERCPRHRITRPDHERRCVNDGGDAAPMAWVHCSPLFVRTFGGCGENARRPCACDTPEHMAAAPQGHDHLVVVSDAIAMYERAILANWLLR